MKRRTVLKGIAAAAVTPLIPQIAEPAVEAGKVTIEGSLTAYFNPGPWRHFAATFKDGIVRCFIDGIDAVDKPEISAWEYEQLKDMKRACVTAGDNTTAEVWRMGAWNNEFWDNFRVSNDVRYDGNFIPQAEDRPAHSSGGVFGVESVRPSQRGTT